MQNILLLFARYGSHILFITLEIFCFYLIINFNKSQREIYLHSASLFTGTINEKVDNFDDFLSLKAVNDSLMRENAGLLERLINSKFSIPTEGNKATSSTGQFELIPAEICGKTIHLRNNHFTLCGGESIGIKPGMGIISSNGIVGVARNVSENYTHVISLLNSQSRISCAIKNRNFFGNLLWKESNPNYMVLEAIPKHAQLAIGDTIITSGYSSIFPKGLDVGVIDKFGIDKGSSNYNIKVKLFNDLSSVEYVYVVKNYFAEEQQNLEQEN